FFFSSGRRHTRFSRDWSSDVCSSDLAVLLLSQHVVSRYAAELLGGGSAKVGYLLKDRVADIDEFLGTLRRVAGGGAAIDPEVVRSEERRVGYECRRRRTRSDWTGERL